MASALLRRSTDSASATAPPSTSMSIWRSVYRSITSEYASTSASTSPMATASSVPLAPPKLMDTSPPPARTPRIWSSMNWVSSGVVPPHEGSPSRSAVTNARVKYFRPDFLEYSDRLGTGNAHASTYGAMFLEPQSPRVFSAGSSPTMGRICSNLMSEGTALTPPNPRVLVSPALMTRL